MNVYDTANQLAQEIKQSDEYAKYKTAKEVIEAKAELKSKIEEFDKARYEAQIIALQTGKNDETRMQHVQELYTDLIKDEDACRFFDAEMKFNILIADVNKIIGEVVHSVIK